uniref:Uncharacterized protein n=1 Tax=Oryza sativa subsp. japonica TaxID=39947 RepID=Q6YUD4_ORYSJ|nr:hypothetical protein [Oryza sativa Japonica Group]
MAVMRPGNRTRPSCGGGLGQGGCGIAYGAKAGVAEPTEAGAGAELRVAAEATDRTRSRRRLGGVAGSQWRVSETRSRTRPAESRVASEVMEPRDAPRIAGGGGGAAARH